MSSLISTQVLKVNTYGLIYALNKPPEMRKKIQTFTMSEKPKAMAMYSSTIGLKPVAWPVVEFEELS